MMDDLYLMEWVVPLVLALNFLAMFLTFSRLVRGPSLPDRVVAIDLMALLVGGILASYSIAAEQVILLDVAIVVAMIGFLGTVAYAHYLERRSRDD